jgi:dTDP-4-dehydrorhamnose 3,5-epimerase
LNEGEPSVLKTAIARAGTVERAALPAGVEVRPLRDHPDGRGSLREVYRQSWSAEAAAVQWNLLRSDANVLRGVRAHALHVDHVTVVAGELVVGLHDARSLSPSFGRSALLRLEAGDPHLVVIPPGVCHGFYAPQGATHLIGLSVEWDGADEVGCAWDDPALNLAWPCEAPVLCDKDRRAGDYAALCAELARRGVR